MCVVLARKKELYQQLKYRLSLSWRENVSEKQRPRVAVDLNREFSLVFLQQILWHVYGKIKLRWMYALLFSMVLNNRGQENGKHSQDLYHCVFVCVWQNEIVQTWVRRPYPHTHARTHTHRNSMNQTKEGEHRYHHMNLCTDYIVTQCATQYHFVFCWNSC